LYGYDKKSTDPRGVRIKNSIASTGNFNSQVVSLASKLSSVWLERFETTRQKTSYIVQTSMASPSVTKLVP
jgi:hypothetical protein